MFNRLRAVSLLVLFGFMSIMVCSGQFTNRYPKVHGYGGVYLEGYDLPILGAGPIDPIMEPSGNSLAFSARGWLWQLDPITGEARRITFGSDVDSRPNWSPDGRHIAFVRDDGQDTKIVQLDLETSQEDVIINTKAIDLDPAFSPDGRYVYYSSGEAGDLDIWRVELLTGVKNRITDDRGLELKPLVLPDGKRLIYLYKGFRGRNQICLIDIQSGDKQILKTVAIASQLRPALHPDGRNLVVNLPGPAGWQLWLLDIEDPEILIPLTRSAKLPLTPTWSSDGKTIHFVEADEKQRFHLKRIPSGGGKIEEVHIRSWDWGEPTNRIIVKTLLSGESNIIPSRLHVSDCRGHPAVPEEGQVRFDSQNGLVYIYSPGILEFEVPLGEVKILATHGLVTPPVTVFHKVTQGVANIVEIELERVWNSHENGWYSGDHHFHLNYGGPYPLTPEDLIPIMQAEDLDVGTPLVANLYNRLKDIEWWNWRKLDASPLIQFGQEIRPDFLGHLGLIGIDTLFWPWYWGPYYPVYTKDDRPNADALKHARQQKGVNAYVHPVWTKQPFEEDNLASIPGNLIVDAVLGDLDTLEIVCLWSDELGTSEVWYRLLNLGIPIAPSAGTDAFSDFYRCMTIGASRVYVRPQGPFNFKSYLSSLKEGRSFVTNGPLLEFRVDGLGPGEILKPHRDKVNWSLDLYSALPVEKVEVLLNGSVVWSDTGLREPGHRSFSGTLVTPEGGWIASRAFGGPTKWPSMASYPFAHSAPLWISRIGSTHKAPEQAAIRDLLKAILVAEKTLKGKWEQVPIPRIESRFQKARRLLEERQHQ